MSSSSLTIRGHYDKQQHGRCTSISKLSLFHHQSGFLLRVELRVESVIVTWSMDGNTWHNNTAIYNLQCKLWLNCPLPSSHRPHGVQQYSRQAEEEIIQQSAVWEYPCTLMLYLEQWQQNGHLPYWARPCMKHRAAGQCWRGRCMKRDGREGKGRKEEEEAREEGRKGWEGMQLQQEVLWNADHSGGEPSLRNRETT